MAIIVIGVVAGTGFLLGVLAGIRIEELIHPGRERQLASQRRQLNDRARALDAYEGVRNLMAQVGGTALVLDGLEHHDLAALLTHDLD